MAADRDALETEIDRLYGLPLDEFTPARDDLARQLRRSGDRDSAERLGRLRKPTVASWALNQARRADPAAVEQLIAAAHRLRDAQERLLTAGDRGELRDAAAEERRLIEELGKAGERQLEAGGHPVTAATQSKLFSTLRAVAGNPETRELLGTGRLARDYSVSDLGLGIDQPAAPIPTKGPEPAKKPDPAKARKMRAAEQRLDRAREKRRKANQKLAEAEKQAHAARREAARTADALERARARATEEADQVAQLEATLRELRAERD
jgi:hypothetical protein